MRLEVYETGEWDLTGIKNRNDYKNQIDPMFRATDNKLKWLPGACLLIIHYSSEYEVYVCTCGDLNLKIKFMSASPTKQYGNISPMDNDEW